MAIIIGAGSSIVANNLLNTSGESVASINISENRAYERLWQLGSFTPYDTLYTNISKSLTLELYGKRENGTGGTKLWCVKPSTQCVDADVDPNCSNPGAMQIIFNPGPTSSSYGDVGFDDTFFVTAYSYSKTNTGYGKETWQFISKPYIPDYAGTIKMLRGIATAQVVFDTDIVPYVNMGVAVDTTASTDAFGNYYASSVVTSLGAGDAFGTAKTTRELVITSVGGSDTASSSVAGKRGEISCTVPMHPVFF